MHYNHYQTIAVPALSSGCRIVNTFRVLFKIIICTCIIIINVIVMINFGLIFYISRNESLLSLFF